MVFFSGYSRWMDLVTGVSTRPVSSVSRETLVESIVNKVANSNSRDGDSIPGYSPHLPERKRRELVIKHFMPGH